MVWKFLETSFWCRSSTCVFICFHGSSSWVTTLGARSRCHEGSECNSLFLFVYVACTIGTPSCIKQVKNAVIYPSETDGMPLVFEGLIIGIRWNAIGRNGFYLEIDHKYEQIMRGCKVYSPATHWVNKWVVSIIICARIWTLFKKFSKLEKHMYFFLKSFCTHVMKNVNCIYKLRCYIH